MTDKEMRQFIRAEVVKKYKRIKAFCNEMDASPSVVSFWFSGRTNMPEHVLSMFGLERIETVEYRGKSCTAATQQNESQS